MGCDIHMIAEKRVDGAWRMIGEMKKDENYGFVGPSWEPYHSRNYNLFSILADVRNGYGFAGIKTGEGFNPISPPKGIPDDASEGYRQWVDAWDGDGHSHSYHTVEELMAFDWTQKTQLQGYINASQIPEVMWAGQPKSWSGMISGPKITHYDLAAEKPRMEAARGKTHWHEFVESPEFVKLYPDQNPHFLHKWEISYSECASEFLAETLPSLWRHGNPADVRICFFFDN